MPTQSTHHSAGDTLQFASFVIDLTMRELRADGAPVNIGMRAFDVLCTFAHNPGRVLTKVELIKAAWPGVAVDENNLQVQVSALRKILGAGTIVTVPGRGYQFTGDVRCEAASSQPRLALDISIAVLAFHDMSESKDQQYFADGIAEEIINALVPLNGIRVAGRTSSFSFKDSNKGITEIGAALGVDHVLEGSVRKQGEQLRITAQLIDARTDTHIWSHNFHGNVDSVFDLQDRIARSVCDELRVLLGLDEDRARLAPTLTGSKEAYDLFLQGRALRERIFGAGVLEQAEDFFKRAIALDPAFAEAWAELGYAYAQIKGYVPERDRRAILAQSFEAAHMAIDLKPEYGLAWTVRSWTPLTEGNFAESVRLAGKACHLSPGNPDVLIRRGYYLTVLGRIKDALPLIRKAVDLDPIQGRNHMVLSMALLAAGDIDGAEHHAQMAIGLRYHAASLPAQLIAQAVGKTELAIDRMVAAAETSAASAFISEMSTPALWRMVGTIVFAGTDAQRAGLVAQMSAMIPEPARRSEIPFLHLLLA